LKILVVDIGSFSVKALYFDKKYSGYSLISFSHTLIKKDPSLSTTEQMLNTIQELKKNNKYEPEKTMIIYPSDKTTNRFITLPFRDHKRINLTLPLELEEQLPFELEDIVYDWQPVENIGKSTKVLVTAVIKEDFESFISSVKSIGLDPDIVTTGSDALLSLSNFLKLGKELVEVEKEGIKVKEIQYHPVLMMDIGASKTTVVITKNGVPEYVRLINYGGDYITRQIMDNYELSYEDAERSKIEVGYIILDNNGNTESSYTDEQINFSNVLKNAYDEIIRDVNQTIASYKADKHENINKCYIVGAGWKTRNFKEYMSQELKFTVEPVEYHKNLGVKLPFAGTPDELTFANTVGFFLRFAGKTTLKGLNLVRESKISGAEGLQEFLILFRPTINNAIAAMVLFLIYMIAHSFILGRMQARYKVELETKFKTAFPDKDKKSQLALLGNYQKLEKEIQTRLKLQRVLLGEDSVQQPDSALLTLRDFSSVIPKDVTVDILDMNISSKSIKITKAIVPKVDDIQRLILAIQDSKKFKDVKPGLVKNVADGSGKEFDISMAYKGGE